MSFQDIPKISQVAQNKPIDRGLCRTGNRRDTFSSRLINLYTIPLCSYPKYSRPCPSVQMINDDRRPSNEFIYFFLLNRE